VLTETIWPGLGGEPALLESLAVDECDAWLGGPLAVDELAVASVAAALLGAVELAEARGAGRPAIRLSAEHVALSFRSERHLLVSGSPAHAGFAPLSRFVRCANGGWARTHANYPHHAAALGRALGVSVGDEHRAPVALERAARSLTAVELEDAVVAAGGCAAALRTRSEWGSHPAGRAVAGTPLVGVDRELAHAAGRDLGPLSDAARPCQGVRVLDLTRVIAGPVAGRTLAALGAEVLRLDPPRLPEIPEQHLETGAGKRSALLDLDDGERREALLEGADVVLLGYRPGALARFELDAPSLAERHPHLVQVSLSAWGLDGPWADRRGFDSLVQVASGIAATCGTADGTPGVLPAQALDHATGHLTAAAALRALAARARGQPFAPAHLALARTARELLEAPPPASVETAATGAAGPDGHRVTFGEVSLIAPPGTLAGKPLGWEHGPRPFGVDRPVWNDD